MTWTFQLAEPQISYNLRFLPNFIELAFCVSSVLFISVVPGSADTLLTVGPQSQYRTISDAVSVANQDRDATHYYIIIVTPGTYLNDFPHVKRPLTIEVDQKRTGQEVLLKATENAPNRKGIIFSEANLTIDGLSFEGAKTPNQFGGNAAGIRDENSSNTARLIIRNSTFSGNQNGILTSPNLTRTITILKSKFKGNGNESITGGSLCCQHAIYISQAANLMVSDSLFCGQLVGHNIKSRALTSVIEDSILYIGAGNTAAGCEAGSGSFAIDLPNGGIARISGSKIVQGRAAQNHNMIAYGEEGITNDSNNVFLGYNSFISSGVSDATVVYDPHCTPIELVRNSFLGISRIVSPAQCGTKSDR